MVWTRDPGYLEQRHALLNSCADVLTAATLSCVDKSRHFTLLSYYIQLGIAS